MQPNNPSQSTENGFDLHHILGDENNSITFLTSPRERTIIPSIQDKAEFSIWAPREPGDTVDKHFKTFYDFFEKPKFQSADHISNAQLPKELERLYEVMNKHGVILQTFTEIPPRTLYRFITKELFNMLTTGKLFPNPLKLVYEEFHSNESYHIRKTISDFVRLLFESFMGPFRIKHLKHSIKNYKDIKLLLQTYEDFALDFMEMDEIFLEGDTASVTFEISFYGINNSGLVHQFKGEGKGELVKHDSSWYIINMVLPDRVR